MSLELSPARTHVALVFSGRAALSVTIGTIHTTIAMTTTTTTITRSGWVSVRE
ncbi:hypothetical protein [Rhodanobacter sp. L36]|uniref:hypothetical protein n=1 Tax=Rhodanobacter sp. L36 TaxID=1747221 RepID=UPI00131D71B0|nr:hypothetical protein [Rhodanobacter sp. L36]